MCKEHFYPKLETQFNIEAIKAYDQALSVLKDKSTKVILAITSWVAKALKKKNLPLKEYMKRGGTLLCCGQFSNTIKPLETNDFFDRIGFPWVFGSYCLVEDQHNPGFSHLQLPNLPEIFSVKATRLLNVDFQEKLFYPAIGSLVQSKVFPTDPLKDPEHASVARAKLGKDSLDMSVT
jgi:hypothetical protein